EAAQAIGLDRVKLDRDIAKTLRSRIAGFGWPRRQIPLPDLLGSDGDALELNIGVRREFPQGLLDLVAGVYPGRSEVAGVIDVGRDLQAVDVFGRAMQER